MPQLYVGWVDWQLLPLVAEFHPYLIFLVDGYAPTSSRVSPYLIWVDGYAAPVTPIYLSWWLCCPCHPTLSEKMAMPPLSPYLIWVDGYAAPVTLPYLSWWLCCPCHPTLSELMAMPPLSPYLIWVDGYAAPVTLPYLSWWLCRPCRLCWVVLVPSTSGWTERVGGVRWTGRWCSAGHLPA